MKKMMNREGAKAFSNTFQDLNGMDQLPGLATQHLMAQVTVTQVKATGRLLP